MFDWLLRLLGLKRANADSAGNGAAAANASVGHEGRERERIRLMVHPSHDPEQFKVQRRRLIVYVSRARVPIRQAAAARQLWIADLGKVYEAIRTSPIPVVLERAGDVGFRYEPAFREALSAAQALEPPPEAEEMHQALVDWLTATHGACLALMDARRLKDRAMLGTFRERLGQARRHATLLAQLRGELFTLYRLRVQPSVRTAKKPPPGQAQAEEEQAPADGRRPGARPGARAAAPARGRPRPVNGRVAPVRAVPRRPAQPVRRPRSA